MSDVSWLNEISKEDAPFVGEKAAYLGEMLKENLPIPPGFVISTDAFKEVFSEIRPEVERLCSSVDITAIESLNQIATRIRDLFLKLDVPTGLKQDISSAYKKMSAVPEEYQNVNKIALDFIKAGRDRPFLILRPSPTTSGPPSQQANFSDINGVEELIQKLKLSWASLFTPRAIYYRRKRNLPTPSMGVIIQERPNLLKSGNVFTVNPLTNNKNQLVIQTRWGFSKQNSESANIFIYDTASKQIVEKFPFKQKTFYVFDAQIMKVAKRDILPELTNVELISPAELSMIEKTSNKVNSIFKFPQDIEWGIAKGKFYVLQSRPITSVFKKPIISTDPVPDYYLKGIPVSPGRIRGKITTSSGQGEILFAPDLTSNVFNSLFGASAVITEYGDLKSLPAIIARELEIPCIVRADQARDKLREGQEIALDAFSGIITTDHPLEQKMEIPRGILTPPILNSLDTSEETEDIQSDEPISIVLSKLTDLEATLTGLVLQEAQKRKDDPHEVSNEKSKMISDLEWEVRSLREKVEKSLG